MNRMLSLQTPVIVAILFMGRLSDLQASPIVSYSTTAYIQGYGSNANGYDLFAPSTFTFAYDAAAVPNVSANGTTTAYVSSPATPFYMSLAIGGDVFVLSPANAFGAINIVGPAGAPVDNLKMHMESPSAKLTFDARYAPATNQALPLTWTAATFTGNPNFSGLLLELGGNNYYDFGLIGLSVAPNPFPEPASLVCLAVGGLFLFRSRRPLSLT